ncbi:unnamed protein product [Sphagnum troendelagicum]|uniref:Uncharacterized protein n=1 Tax=Sphagnum jensenii TaxID=128206 RepID=A0ABP0X8K6_9BRYO
MGGRGEMHMGKEARKQASQRTRTTVHSNQSTHATCASTLRRRAMQVICQRGGDIKAYRTRHLSFHFYF